MRNEGVGLWMIGSSVGVILVTGLLLLSFERRSRSELTLTEGIRLVRLLSQIPHEKLVPEEPRRSPLHVLRDSRARADFAYAVVVDLDGNPLFEVVAPGFTVPTAPAGLDPASWFGDRELGGERPVREFFAPVLSGAMVTAHVRVGFFQRGFWGRLGETPVLLGAVLPVGLLGVIFYFLLCRELLPLSLAAKKLEEIAQGAEMEPIWASGALLKALNRFIERTRSGLDEAHAGHAEALASSKVLSYQVRRIESVLEALPDAAIVLDESGTVTFANAKLEGAVGVTPEEAVGQRPRDWCEDPELLAFLARFEGISGTRARSESTRLTSDASAGPQLEVAAYPLVLPETEAEVRGTFVMVRDVTAESLLRKGQAEFVSHVAHELKAPLNVLGMYSEELLEKGGSEEFRVDACNVIHDEVDRLSALISALLSVSQIEVGAVSLDRQRVRLPDFLGDTLESVSRVGKREDLTFELEVSEEICSVYIDKQLIRVAVSNLLTNAIKYNREGGSVTLTAEESENALTISVRDTGVGISAADQDRIFKKFFRTADAREQVQGGHGLGLTLVKQVAELHGGEIRVASAPGEGSAFSLVLPKTPVLMNGPTLS